MSEFLSQSLMLRIIRKELAMFFASPIAWLFLGVFLALTLFVFFWVEAFFSRNIADVRPLFQWLPLVMIFLASALTMRMWSEERRSGTLEFVHTLPVSLLQFVLGKFFSCLFLLIIALLLTLPLPFMVSVIADLDWGPVIAAYLATVLLGAVYVSIGLFVSARTDNQIVSLMLSVLLCVLLYLPGTALFNSLLDTGSAELFRQLGTGSRFEAIARGVIDVRDLYFYLSLIIAFLGLNVFTLEKQRWAKRGGEGQGSPHHHRQWQAFVALLIANALLMNVWLDKVHALRFDVTANQGYSLSQPTRDYLAQLQEPLIIRGYFTAKTHPLLSPLVPQIQDLIREFEVYGDGKVKTEFIDPATNPAQEEEANSKYGIGATPFQVSDRYQAGMVNSYFDLVVQYGDQFEVLTFRDLIEIRIEGEADLDVKLRNPEYDLTNAIRKVLYSFQSGGNPYAALPQNVIFNAYFSSNTKLPEKLQPLRAEIEKSIKEQVAKSQGKLTANWIDPELSSESATLATLNAYGFKPMTARLGDENTFYFYMTLEQAEEGSDDDAGKIMQIPFPEDLNIVTFNRNFNNALQRFAKGFTRQVALVTPPVDPYAAQFGQGSRQFTNLQKHLEQNIDLKPNDLSSGKVPDDTDVLLILSPENFTEMQVFAVDQFLMQGGTVIVATSPFAARLDNNQLSVAAHASGMESWLNAMGVSMQSALVMDERNTAFPIPVTRKVGEYSFQEVSLLDYPYFIDIRGDGMNRDVPLTASLNQMTMTWASPLAVTIDNEKNIQAVELLHSSERAWLSESLDVMPKVKKDGTSGFVPGDNPQKYLLGVALSGTFESYFKNKPSPLVRKEEQDPQAQNMAATVRQASSSSARLVVFPSNEFLTDQTLGLEAAVTGSEYLPPLDLIVNTIDWAFDDAGLSSIRSRSQFGNTLPPMLPEEQRKIEYTIYSVCLLALCLVIAIQWLISRRRLRRYQSWLLTIQN